MSAAQRAYGFARVSALKSRLLTRDDVTAFRCTTDERASQRAAEALGLESDEKRFARLISRYRTVLRAYTEATPIVRAMLQIHEIENVKIAWRAAIRKIDSGRWQPLLRDLSDVTSCDMTALRDASSLYEIVQALERTSLHDIAREIYSVHGNDLAAAELAFDRWASLQILQSVDHLGSAERLARDIAIEVVRERDDEVVGRTNYGFSPAAVDAARVLGRSAPPRQDLIRLCRRAFVGQTLRLAPPLAFIVFAERDYRLANALAERRGDTALDGVVESATAGRASA